MIKANALFIVIVLALIIGIITGSLILVAFNYRIYVQTSLLKQRVELNVNSAVNLLLAGSEALSEGDGKIIDLYGEENDSVFLKKTEWGLFEVGVCRAFAKNFERRRSILMGYRPTDISKAAIYLVDEGNSLSISGKTEIRGTCYLPEAGVKTAQIGQYYYSGNKLIHGVVKKSSNKLPEINKAPLEKLIEIFEAKTSDLESRYQFISRIEGDSLIRSFFESAVMVKGPKSFSIQGKHLVGQVLLLSDSLITVSASSTFEDVIILAPKIKIEEGFEGSIQAFATDSLLVGKKCVLRYPSVLGIIKKDFQEQQPKIILEEGVKFKGFIFSYQKVQDLYRTVIKTSENCVIEGQIFADGYLELKGTLLGSATCYKFILNTPSTFYENHLLNISINSEKLSPHYLAPLIMKTRARKNIVKWLD